MDNDLISRSALRQEIETCLKTIGCFDGYEDSQSILAYIDNAPAVDAIQMEQHEKILDQTISELFKCQEELEKVRNEIRSQGEWLHNSDRPDTLICSACNCGWDMWRYESKELKYCPNCGAQMTQRKIPNEKSKGGKNESKS